MSATDLIEVENSSGEIPRYSGPATSSVALVMDGDAMDRMMRLAEVMASGKSTVPAHLRNSPGDCMAVVMQSMQWKMMPFAVAQKTHLVNGTLGYEAQLVAAVVNSSGVVLDRFHFDWFGDWAKVIGKFEIRKSDKGEYRTPGWKLSDEEGLGVRVWATLKGEAEPRYLDLLLAQARTRNSTLWADDPKQQLAYLAQKRWARLYAPDVLLGVYTPDELAEPPAERDITPVGGYQEATKPATRTDSLKSRLGAGRTAAAKEDTRNPALLGQVIDMIAGSEGGDALKVAKAKASELTDEKDIAEAMQAYQARVTYLKGVATTKDALLDQVNAAETDDELDMLADEARQLPDVLSDEVYAAIKDRREMI